MVNKDNLEPEKGVTADPAEADNENVAAAVLGKFKDVQTLAKAYSDLEAEFTRRSQRLKELEKGNKAEVPSDGAGDPLSRISEEQLLKSALESAKVRDAVIGEYLKNVAETKSVPLTAGGAGCAAPRKVPKSVKEAGRLAQEFLKN